MNYFLHEFNIVSKEFFADLLLMEKKLRERSKDKSLDANAFMSQWDQFLRIQNFYKTACMTIAALVDEAEELPMLKTQLEATRTRLHLLLEQAAGYGLDTTLLGWCKPNDLLKYPLNESIKFIS